MSPDIGCSVLLGNHHVVIGERGNCLQLATAEAIDQRSITGFYAKPTNYTSVGVSVGRGARSPIERQPVIASPQSETIWEDAVITTS